MLQVKVNTAQWERALKELSANNAVKAGIRAVNRTLTSSRSAVVKDVAPDVGLQQKVVREQVTIIAAKNTGQAPHGSLWATTKRVPLIDFKAKATKRGVTAKLKGGAGRYPHAFIRTTRSGHTGVFQRAGATRLPIYELKGPSLYHAFQKHAPVAQSRAVEVLDKNVAHELAYMLAQAKQ